ncbi:hypothetical protein SAMN05518672_104416 [Chitinophaga sp. CF118]|nr:hypothetical protein SAMN05518672_104416 [Chitinophaga sp. CF118]
MKHFVKEDSVVREIWGKADTILFIFAGAAAEFALNKAVDWLYFTGKLPADPLGRLFSTITYARQIVFSTNDAAYAAIDQITAIHKHVETSRNAQIPDWAYRDVLFMLIDYSIRAYELLERKLTSAEKEEVFNTFYKVGARMQLEGLPTNYHAWEIMREEHLKQDLQLSDFTNDLFKKYCEHLGVMRYYLLKQVQALLVPKVVKKLLSLGNTSLLLPVLYMYKLSRIIKLQSWLRDTLLPVKYRVQIKLLNNQNPLT